MCICVTAKEWEPQHAKHSVAVSERIGSGPCPEGLFFCGSQEKAPAGEIPEVYLLSHSLQDPGAFPPLRWASCHFSDSGSVSHGVCQKVCFHIYAPPLQETQLTENTAVCKNF